MTPYGSDRVRVDGERIVLSSRLPKGWTARVERTLTSAEFPGTAVLWDEQYFEVIGADFIHGRELAAYLNARQIPGVRGYPVRFRPISGNFAKVGVEGVRWVVNSRESFNSVRLGLEVAAALQKLYPGKISFAANRKLIGSQAAIHSIEVGEDPRMMEQKLEGPLVDFLAIRERYLLYR